MDERCCSSFPVSINRIECERERGHGGLHTFMGRVEGKDYTVSWSVRVNPPPVERCSESIGGAPAEMCGNDMPCATHKSSDLKESK